MCLIWRVIDYVRWLITSHVFNMASYWLREWIENLFMCLIWQVIDYVRWSKTSYVFDMVSFWLRELIENSSCAWYGELLIVCYGIGVTSLQPDHAENFVFFTFPTGHEETTPPIGGGFSDARFAFSSEISLSRACSTATPRSRHFLRPQQYSLAPLLLA